MLPRLLPSTLPYPLYAPFRRCCPFLCHPFPQPKPLMEHATAENSQHSTLSTSDTDHHLEGNAPNLPNDEETELNITVEEIRSIMEVIAATGKFWHNWDVLKCLLSFQLKQVLADYPEAQMVSGNDGPQQNSLSGETYPDLVKRLDEALLSFIEGPPFTLQRLCEILLDPKGTYKSLSKLALALEKNLLVTSTLRICTDPYPRPASPRSAEKDGIVGEPKGHSALFPNGVETKAGDVDEEMVEAESDEGVRTANAVVHDARIVDTEINDAQIADNEVVDAQNADTMANEAHITNSEVKVAQNVDTKADEARIANYEVKAAQDVDTEMKDEKANDTLDVNPDPSSDSDPSIEPSTSSEQTGSAPQQP